MSAITDHFRDKWEPTKLELNGVWITQSQWQEYQTLKQKMELYDKQTGQPDCVKPEVAEWEKAMEAFLVKRGVLK